VLRTQGINLIFEMNCKEFHTSNRETLKSLYNLAQLNSYDQC